jgi:hypothetical protein
LLSESPYSFARSFPIGVIARQKSDANLSETGLDETRFGGAFSCPGCLP